MKILLTNHALNYPGGSETACYTLAAELIRLGHEVDYRADQWGIVSKKMDDLGCGRFGPKEYDLAICSHIQNVRGIPGLKIKRLIRVCHGTTPKLEQPQPGADHYVAISEEVQEHLKGLGYQSTVIRNGIDCERFKPLKPVNPELRKVLLISASDKAEALLKKACDAVGASLTVTNKVVNPRWDMENLINEHDLVVSLGRGALEGMACGRPMIVWDWRNYQGNMGDGLIIPELVGKLSTVNFSGRWVKSQLGKDQLVSDIKLAKFFTGIRHELRQWVLQNANIRHTAQQYLAL